MTVRKRHIWIVLFCVYMTAVAYLCFMKPDSMPKLSPELWGIPMDKLAHFLMFFPYPIIGYAAFMPPKGGVWSRLLVLFAIFTTGIGMAIGTEHIQGVLGYRTNDINDMYTDLMGMGCAAILVAAYILSGKLKKR